MQFRKLSFYRSEAYLAHVRALPCCVCGYLDYGTFEAHHVRTGGKAIKCHDLETVPLCHDHHMELGDIGKVTFCRKYDVNFRDVMLNCMMRYVAKLEGKEPALYFEDLPL